MGKFAIGVIVGVVGTIATAVIGATYTAHRVSKAVNDCLDDLNEEQKNEEQKNEQQFVHWEVDVLNIYFFFCIHLTDRYILLI